MLDLATTKAKQGQADLHAKAEAWSKSLVAEGKTEVAALDGKAKATRADAQAYARTYSLESDKIDTALSELEDLEDEYAGLYIVNKRMF